jgi:hypothetical protein
MKPLLDARSTCADLLQHIQTSPVAEEKALAVVWEAK